MAGPNDLSVRSPAVAGIFYPAEGRECRSMAEAMLRMANEPAEETAPSWTGGIVPHAGWICSGAIAAQTVAALARLRPFDVVDVVVIFGAVHSPTYADYAALDTHGQWQLPAGEAHVNAELTRRLTESSASLFEMDERFHRREHAVEVEVPLVQVAWPSASILPVEVPAIDVAAEIGRRTAIEVTRAQLSAVFLASSDLTHYGPNYDFAPAGIGEDAMRWALDNDRRLLEAVTDLSVERIVPEVREHFNACGAGAIAAMLAACRELGANQARVLRHANSYQTLAGAGHPQKPVNAVGYASVVVGSRVA
jgi:AmmeMemoRadiSam system protein B